MSHTQLGRLKEVDIRNLWSHEQYDFSEWLSKHENLELLNEVIGITLSEVEKEVYVGSYRCDLVGNDETTGDKVIIENQLEASNHDHLGKIITYASGLDAKVIVWIVKEAREEHRSAIEWLNNNTSERLNFFLIEIHAYQIGDSLCAPKFEIVEKPNGFIKNAKTQSGTGEYNKSQGEKIEFWTRFNMCVEKKKNLKKTLDDITKRYNDIMAIFNKELDKTFAGNPTKEQKDRMMEYIIKMLELYHESREVEHYDDIFTKEVEKNKMTISGAQKEKYEEGMAILKKGFPFQLTVTYSKMNDEFRKIINRCFLEKNMRFYKPKEIEDVTLYKERLMYKTN